MVKSIGILDKDYTLWVKELVKRYRGSQIKAAIKVNRELLRYYWELGKDIEEKQVDNKYGSKFYATLSRDLRHEMPDVEGLSETSIRYAKRFYTLYKQQIAILPQIVEESEKENLPQLVERLYSDLFSIPWGHHRYIIDKCSTDSDKALFYVRQTLENGWSRDILLNVLGTNLYERSGKALTNFKSTLPDVDSDLAQELTRDPYDFSFTGLRGKYNERLLKDTLLTNITNFLLELGTGFAYVGKEYRLQIAEKEKFIDLLFYNLKLSCYVVVEVKIGEFDFSFMEQWNIIKAYDYCYNVTDGTHDSPKQTEFGKYLITSKHIKDNRIDFESAYKISEDDYNKIITRSKVDQWDIIISMIGAYCGFCCIESSKQTDYAIKNVGLLKVGNELKCKWLYYYLTSPHGKQQLSKLRSGSSQPYISLGALRNLDIPVPNENTMIDIVSVLSSLDSKIELNRRINDNLIPTYYA